MSLQNVFEIDVDIKSKTAIRPVSVTQNDTVVFIFRIFDEGRIYNIQDGTTFAMTSTRPDRQAVMSVGERTGTNLVEFKLGSTELAVKGKVDAVIQVYDAVGRVSTIPFKYEVLNDPSTDYVPSEDEKTLIQQVLGDGPRILTDAEQATNDANTAALLANESAQAAVEATEKANTATVSANNAATNANTQAEYAKTQGDYAKTEADRAKAETDRLVNVDAAQFDSRLTAVSEQLAEKANKGEISVLDIDKNKGLIDETYLSDTLKQQIAGEAPIHAVPVERSITTKHITFPAVLGKPSKNLFDKTVIERDKGLNTNTGETFDLEGYFVSDYIFVLPNTKYHLYTAEVICFYDENKTIISSMRTPYEAFTTPVNTKFVRFSAPLSKSDYIQLERGENYTGYESYGVKLDPSTVEADMFDGEMLKEGSTPVNKISTFKMGKNLFNKDTVIENKFVAGDGNIGDNSDYVLSEYIPVKPNTTYTANELQYSAYYDKSKKYLSGNGPGSIKTITTPNNAYYIRVSVPKTMFDTYQLELGTEKTPYEPYQYELKYLIVKNISLSTSHRNRLYSFKDAWIAWENGQKFPVGFLGDSTTDGASTSTYRDEERHEAQDLANGGYGTVDYINTKAYPYLLEQLIKKETGKSKPRIYNIGYSGTYLDWAKPKLDNIFGSVYADVKMVGITYGINDRTRVGTTADYELIMGVNLEYFVNYFFNKGIQPFMVTSQAVVEPGVDTSFLSYPLRTSENINSVANRVKREIAKKYNLEIIEMTDFGEHAMTYSSYSLKQIIGDKLHFKDIGHKLEAEFLFSQFCPRVITIKDKEVLGFQSQRIKSNVPSNLTTLLDAAEDGFKVKADYTKEDLNDLLMQDFWVLNYSKKSLELKAYLTTVGTQYVKLNDTNITLTSNGQSLGMLDIGLHHIQAFSGLNTKVDFKGFTLNKKFV